MSNFTLETTEHSFDDVPWHGHGERFKTFSGCRSRIRELINMPRENDVTIIMVFMGVGVHCEYLERKP